MSPLKVLFALAALALIGPQAASAQRNPGAQGGEGEPGRMQQWLVPTPAQDVLSHALLFRPPGEGPFPLAVIAHATTQNVLRRAQMPQPVYRALAAWLVARGFAVLVPERAGHGATGGKYLEDQGGCDEADYVRSGRVTADAIASAAGFMRKQSFIKPGGTMIVGHSAGGWGALALTKEDPKDVTAIIVFAAGRGGRANDRGHRHSRHRRRHRLLYGDGASQPRRCLDRAHRGDRRHRRYAVYADGGAAAAGDRLAFDDVVIDRLN